MLSTPLTPPNEHTIEAGHLAEGFGHPTVSQLSFGTPVSPASIGLDDQDKMSNIGRASDQDMTDEDEEMSEGGGAPLTMTLSHAERLNAEMDMIDIEVMGEDNLEEMYLEHHSPHWFDHHSLDDSDMPMDTSMDQPEPPQDGTIHTSGSLVNLPSAMSQVSLHLQHLQEEQESAEATAVVDDEHVASFNGSTPSILLNILSHMNTTSLGDVAGPQLDFVAPIELSTITMPGGAGVSQPLQLHLWPNQESTSSSALDVVVPTTSQNPSISISTAPAIVNTADDEPDADQNEVDENLNMSLDEFLTNWGTSALASKDPRIRASGPDLLSIRNQRSQTLPIMEMDDLKGEDCDIQRLNWTELGVSRLQARQMRRQTYRNYQNLGRPVAWHVRILIGLSDDLILTLVASEGRLPSFGCEQLLSISTHGL